MESTDSRIDDYIAKAQPFARPIIIHLRELMHKASREMKETIKWGAPNFDYKGMVCMIAAFKEHVGLAFRKDKLMKDPHGLFGEKAQAIGSLGKIKSLKDLPPDKILLEYIKEAVQLNEAGAKLTPKKTDLSKLIVPEYFIEALKNDTAAIEQFEKLTPGYKKEYIEWFEEAKTDATRQKRMVQALEWIAEGKSRNWKYK